MDGPAHPGTGPGSPHAAGGDHSRGYLWGAPSEGGDRGDLARRYLRTDFRLGSGASCRVFLGHDRHNGCMPVALKVMHRHCATPWGDQGEFREARLLMKLRHPAVVECHGPTYHFDSLLQHWDVTLVFELTHGDLQRELLARGRLPEGEAKRHLHSLLSGLSHLGECGISHGDVKPSNLLLQCSQRGTQLKIADFGDATDCAAGPPGPDGAKWHAAGTAGFRAPELLIGMREPLNPGHSDVWAAGCVFAQTLCGRMLLPGEGQLSLCSQLEHMLALRPAAPIPQSIPGLDGDRLAMFGMLRARSACAQQQPLPDILRPHASGCAVALLERMLDFDPASRISAAQAVASDYFASEPAMLSPEQLPQPVMPEGLRAALSGCGEGGALASPPSSAASVRRGFFSPNCPSSGSRKSMFGTMTEPRRSISRSGNESVRVVRHHPYHIDPAEHCGSVPRGLAPGEDPHSGTCGGSDGSMLSVQQCRPSWGSSSGSADLLRLKPPTPTSSSPVRRRLPFSPVQQSPVPSVGRASGSIGSCGRRRRRAPPRQHDVPLRPVLQAHWQRPSGGRFPAATPGGIAWAPFADCPQQPAPAAAAPGSPPQDSALGGSPPPAPVAVPDLDAVALTAVAAPPAPRAPLRPSGGGALSAVPVNTVVYAAECGDDGGEPQRRRRKLFRGDTLSFWPPAEQGAAPAPPAPAGLTRQGERRERARLSGIP